MSAVPQRTEAGGAGGASFVYRRQSRLAVWLEEGRWLRLLAALLAALLARAIETWGAAVVPVPLVPFAALASGLLFGPWGVAGAWVGELLAVLLAGGGPGGWSTALAAATAGAISGLGAWLVFRYVPTLGRGIPNVRSYLAVLAVALLGGTLGALVVAVAGGAAPGASRFTLLFSGAVRSLVSAVLFAPPVLLGMDRFGRKWMALIKGETLVERLFGIDPLLPLDGEQTMALPLIARAETRRIWTVGTALVLGVAGLAVLLAGFFPEAGAWVPLLFLVPMLWAAPSHGLRGALLVTAVASLLYVLGVAWTDASPRPVELWAARPDLLILSLAAALVGRSHERESRLLQELGDRNRLLRRDLLRVAEALTHAVETKDSYTEGHLRRVSQYAVAVGEKLGVRGQELELLYVASMLHDVGKLGVPEQVLHKDGPLEPHEEEIMRRHPEIGARLLEKLELLNEVAPLVLHHQERFDGRRQGTNPGYPRGLSGEEIPLGARIIAVVDAYDAMTTDRPYRPAVPIDDATSTLRHERGRQFDPKVVDAFLDCLVERPWRIH